MLNYYRNRRIPCGSTETVLTPHTTLEPATTCCCQVEKLGPLMKVAERQHRFILLACTRWGRRILAGASSKAGSFTGIMVDSVFLQIVKSLIITQFAYRDRFKIEEPLIILLSIQRLGQKPLFLQILSVKTRERYKVSPIPGKR